MLLQKAPLKYMVSFCSPFWRRQMLFEVCLYKREDILAFFLLNTFSVTVVAQCTVLILHHFCELIKVEHALSFNKQSRQGCEWNDFRDYAIVTFQHQVNIFLNSIRRCYINLSSEKGKCSFIFALQNRTEQNKPGSVPEKCDKFKMLPL